MKRFSKRFRRFERFEGRLKMEHKKEMWNWNDIFEEIYQEAQCVNWYIESPISTVNSCITGNAMLYLPDIKNELYLKFLSDDEGIVDELDGGWADYEELLERDEKKNNVDWEVISEIKQKKRSRENVRLLGSINSDNYRVEGKSIIFPNISLAPLYILYAQNSEFFKLFTYQKNGEKQGDIVIKYGYLLEQYDESEILGYAYEKLTGINLALLFANYYVDIVKILGVKIYDCALVDIVEDRDWQAERLELKNQIKNKMLKLLKELMGCPMVLGRVWWADIILQSLYVSMKKHMQVNVIEQGQKKGLLWMKNEDIVMYLLKQISTVMAEMQGEREEEKQIKALERRLFGKNPKPDDAGEKIQFERIKELYEVYNDVLQDKMKDQGEKVWSNNRIMQTNSWEAVEKYIRKIITPEEDESMVGCEDIGYYVKDEAKKKSDEKLPIIFIKDSLMQMKDKNENGEEFWESIYKQDINDFITGALAYGDYESKEIFKREW